jgi:hypothetical protein
MISRRLDMMVALKYFEVGLYSLAQPTGIDLCQGAKISAQEQRREQGTIFGNRIFGLKWVDHLRKGISDFQYPQRGAQWCTKIDQIRGALLSV